MADIFIEKQAKRIFEIALESQDLNGWQANLRRLSGLTRDTALMRRIDDPSVSPAEKSKELARRLSDTGPVLIELISELIGQGRLAEIEDISIEYQRLLDIHRGIEGIENATITTAIPLDEDYLLRIGEKLTALSGKPVIVEAKVDPAVIGGIVINIGDKVIDGSVRSRLASLKKEIGRAVK